MLGCETESNWQKRHLNFERKGTQTECLHKGYGHGVSHTFLLEEKETLTPTQLANLKEWGTIQGEPIIVNQLMIRGHRNVVLDILPEYATDEIPINLFARSDKEKIYKFIRGAYHGYEDEEKAGLSNLSAYEVWLFLEDYQNMPDECCFLGPERALSIFRKKHGYSLSRNIEFLEESFSFEQNSKVFDQQDLRMMFRARNPISQHSRFLFALPSLSKDLRKDEDDQHDLLCEVNFEHRFIGFYCLDDAQLEWYTKIMMQQFVLPEEQWRVYRFPIPDLETLIIVAITRMQGGLLTNAYLSGLTNKRQRIFSFFARLAAT